MHRPQHAQRLSPTSIHAALATTLNVLQHDAKDEAKSDAEQADHAELPDLIDLSDPVEWFPLAEPYCVMSGDTVRAKKGFFLSYGNRDAFVPEGTLFSSSKVTRRGQTIQEVEIIPQDCLELKKHGHTRLIVKSPVDLNALKYAREP